MPEIAVQRLIQYGISELRKDQTAFNEIFAYQIEHPLIRNAYGQEYVDKIWSWFTSEKIRVVQSWILSTQTVPCYSIHLSNETEDESKAALSDYLGDGEDSEIGVNAFSVQLDIGIHASKAADKVLWMYYIASYILFKYKDIARTLGIEIQTYSASDWQKDAGKMPENIWTRWLKMRCTVFNTWSADSFIDVTDLDVDVNNDQV